MSHPKKLIPLFAISASAVLLAGCGGGGGGGNGGGNGGGGGGTPPSNLSTVFGKIVDTAGSPVPSAVVSLDGQVSNATFSQGGFELTNVTPGFHVVTASTTVGGVTYTGVTDVGTPSVGARVTNANIIVASASQQAAVGGFVTDSNGNPVSGARVFFQTTFASPNSLGVGASAPPSTTGIVAYTASNGEYQIGGENIIGTNIPEPGLPVLQGTANSPRTYTITAGSLPVNGVASKNATTITQTFTAGESLVPSAQGSGGLNFHLQPGSGTTGLTPTINFVQAFTQPDLQAVDPPQVLPAAAAAVYQQVRALVSPQYAHLLATRRAAAQIKHVASAVAHATASNYTVEMDVFFSLPGDSSSGPDPNRSELAGFDIYNDAFGQINQLGLYDVLIDPLANFWADPDLAAGSPTYSVDTPYDFAVESVATDGTTTLGTSPSVRVQPLSFVNLSQPADPNDTHTTAVLAADPTFQWTAVDPATHSANQDVAAYYVFVYNAFPGVSTTPIYESGPMSLGTTFNVNTGLNSFTLPASGTNLPLTPGTTYWLVVAAASSLTASNSSAVSVSQIVPFTVQ